MCHREFRQRRQRLVPALLRFVRIHRGGGNHLAGRVHDRDLDAGAITGIEPHGDARAGGRREQQVAQVGREYADGFLLGRVPQPHPQVDVEMDLDPGAPRRAHGFSQPFVAGAALIGNRKTLHDLQFIRTDGRRRRGDRLGQHLQVEDFLLFAAEHRQNSMRRQFGELLAEIEIVLELFALGSLALARLRGQHAVRPHLLAQAADQVGVLVETLDKDGAGAVERGRGIGHLLLGIDERRGQGLRLAFRLGQQQVGQRFQSRLLGDFGLGAALRLERQIDVFETALAVGGQNGRLQGRVQLALLADGFQNRGAALLEFTQVIQPLFQGAQLRDRRARR